MSIYSWQLPTPAPAVAGGGAFGGGSTATAATTLGGLLDQEIDPLTLDYLDTADGEWSETADSRSIVLIMIETELGASVSAPTDGTRIAERIRLGDPVTTGFVVSELVRILQILTSAGVIANAEVNGTDEHGDQLTDENDRPTFELRYDDLASGSPVDLSFTPAWG